MNNFSAMILFFLKINRFAQFLLQIGLKARPVLERLGWKLDYGISSNLFVIKLLKPLFLLMGNIIANHNAWNIIYHNVTIGSHKISIILRILHVS